MSTLSGAVSDPRVLKTARMLRVLTRSLEATLWAVVAGSVLAIGAVHAWAYVPLGLACLAMGVLLVCRAVAVVSLRRIVGRQSVAFHPSGGWVVLDARPAHGPAGWTLDLDRPAFPSPPLLWPGLGFLAWVLVQIVPLPPALNGFLSPGRAAGGWRPLTVSLPDTLRGFAFVASALLLHLGAAATFERRPAGDSFSRALSGLGLALALAALVQLASGTQRVYGFFTPLEKGGAIFGPFVNRNHFAGYMLMVVPISLGVVADAYRRYGWRVGERTNLRRRLVALRTPEGAILAYASIPAMATVAALLATTSRGALMAFAASLVLVGLAMRTRGRRKGGRAAWVSALLFTGLALYWFGVGRLEERFRLALHDRIGRTAVWRDALGRMDGLWATGSGFNTFAQAMSRATAWTLPIGSTPWPEELRGSPLLGPRGALRTPSGLPDLAWFREAHNDYVQVLVETGVPGLVLALWAVTSILRSARHDPWLLAALSGVLAHAFVDFDFQIPAIVVLFVTLAAMPRGHPGARRT